MRGVLHLGGVEHIKPAGGLWPPLALLALVLASTKCQGCELVDDGQRGFSLLDLRGRNLAAGVEGLLV